MFSRRIAFLSLAVLLSATTLPAAALADEASCNADKLKSLSSVLSRYLRCSAKGVMKAEPPDPDCAVDADARLVAGFAEADADPQCAASGEVPSLQSAMHDLESDLRNLLVVTAEGRRCASGKLRVVTKRAQKELTCRRRAAVASVPPDPGCLLDAQAVLTDGFAYREMHGACETTGDAAAAEDLVSDFLTYASAQIDGSFDDGEPTDLAAVIDGAAIDLTWTAPGGGSAYTHARVLRRLNAAVAGPTDPSATVVFSGTGEAALDALTDLLPNTTTVMRTYHYAVYGCDSMANCESVGSHTTLTPTVRQALVAGGYVIHWRHADADVCSDNQSLGKADVTMVPDWWKSCDANCGTATARQMNAQGVLDATAIGDAFDTLGIPVGRVLSSEYCRNVQTAVLMDFGPIIEESQELTYWVYDEASRCADTFVMLGDAPTAGSNTALIGHAGNVCSPLSDLAWGEAAIYKPDGIGGTTFIQRVLENAWLSLP
jgi:phosphohistidine phosphatase SixA